MIIIFVSFFYSNFLLELEINTLNLNEKIGQKPNVTESLSKIGVKEQMDDADWLQLALNLQNRLSRREADRRATDGRQPAFNLCINNDGYEVGRNYIMMARVEGKPSPVVTWYRNDEALHDGYRVATHSSSESGHAWLTLLMAKPHDAAVYKCVARNAFGITRSRALVAEGDVPGAPGRPVIAEVSSHEAFVIWDAPTASGNLQSRYYKVDYRQDGYEKWTCAGYVIDESAYVNTLKPNTIYRFRVSCGNRLSLGNYSYGSIELKTKDTGSLPQGEYYSEISKKRQFSRPPIIDVLRRRGYFILERSISSVSATSDFFKVVDPVTDRPLQITNGSDLTSMLSDGGFAVGETIKRSVGMTHSHANDSKGQRYVLKQASKTSSGGLKLARELEILRDIESNRIELVKAAFETENEIATVGLPINVDLDIVQHLAYKNKARFFQLNFFLEDLSKFLFSCLVFGE